MSMSNAQRLTYLNTIIENTYAELATLSGDATTAGGKPNASGPNVIDHTGYERKLWDRIRWAEESIVAMQGPVEYTTEGYV